MDADDLLSAAQVRAAVSDAFYAGLVSLEDALTIVSLAASGQLVEANRRLEGSVGTMGRGLDTEAGTVASPSVSPFGGELAAERYRELELLGEGGMGRVSAVHDQKLRRPVALKTIRRDRDPGRIEARFEREVLVTSQLEHPGLIPVYDAGRLADGRPYYTMRMAATRSLREILVARRVDPAFEREQWTLARFCAVLERVCEGVGFAHARGIVHRDLKPDNVLLGHHGEVYVADWGIAKLLDDEAFEATGETDVDAEVVDALAESGTRFGEMVGTLTHMAPEQIDPHRHPLGPRADIYALGVILYEVLTGRLPHAARSPMALMASVLQRTPETPATLNPRCPAALGDLCMQMLERDPDARPASAELVAQGLRRWIDGTESVERARREAAALVVEGERAAASAIALDREARRTLDEANALGRAIAGHEDSAAKRPWWALEDQAAERDLEAATAAARAALVYAQALGRDADSLAARDGLARLYWAQAERAEAAGRVRDRVFFESLVREYDVGRYAASLDGQATLQVEVDDGVPWFWQRMERVDRRLVEGDWQAGEGQSVKCEPGIVWLEAHYPVRTVRWSVRLARNATLAVRLARPPRRLAELDAEAFAFVPSAEATLGGDPEAYAALPETRATLPPFAIARRQVTFGEYLAFLNAVEAVSPERALTLRPRDGYGVYAERVDGRWRVSEAALLDEENASLTARDLPELAVFSIGWYEAAAFCRWRREVDGLPWRLPTSAEWEVAGRGGAAVRFPWGDDFDATFCKMRSSRAVASQPEPVERFAVDRSVFGVADLAGSCRDWVLDHDDDAPSLVALERLVTGPPEDGVPDCRCIRGGGWSSQERSCRLASRASYPTSFRNVDAGFRLALSLDE